LYGDLILESWGGYGDSYGVLDTGTSMLAIPKKYHEILAREWRAAVGDDNRFRCEEGLCYAAYECEDLGKIVKSLSFVIGNKVFEIKPSGYLLVGLDFDESYDGICLFGVSALPDSLTSSSNMFLFGDVFLRNFYSVFDWDNQQVRLGINKHSVNNVGPISVPTETPHLVY